MRPRGARHDTPPTLTQTAFDEWLDGRLLWQTHVFERRDRLRSYRQRRCVKRAVALVLLFIGGFALAWGVVR